ncbi:O-acetyl-ADP-ribose deacetylase [Cytophagaceae bacterium YF14B1]|uniref:O-acetyl-ADP-ribose deacetylase n=1 Tax=Xanthocytophaga flava TaxID=3048013 RepID=A0AAE3U5L7_9BACT|nr:O-acetyl-ADP-ribose deacetylase [Xanthocytophaga flavus]MDJ1480406.1 O-acetyl-ADP-ribose deacetylase [Xanthocytophaga flavus]
MTIELLKGDITTIPVDVIVNAANSSLLGGGGVDGAIHRKGGKAILEECLQIRNRQGGCATGEAVYTTAGNLLANYVIHTVGPVWNGGSNKESQLLQSCYLNSLRIANELTLKSIAFPNISTGIYHYPKQQAAEIAIHAVRAFGEEESSLEQVFFVCFDDENYQIYQKILSK